MRCGLRSFLPLPPRAALSQCAPATTAHATCRRLFANQSAPAPAPSSSSSSSSPSSDPVRPLPLGLDGKDAADWRARIAKSDAERKAKAAQQKRNIRAEIKGFNGVNHDEFYRTAGKPFTTPIDLSHSGNSAIMPRSLAFKCPSLTNVEFVLPELFHEHSATLLIIGYNQQAYDNGVKWADEFEKAFPQDESQTKVKLVQLSIISNALIGTLFGHYMIRSFKSTIPPSRHSFTSMLKENPFDTRKVASTWVAPNPQLAEQENANANGAKPSTPTVDGDAPTAPLVYRTAMAAEPGWSIQNPLLCHLFLVDHEARIRWKAVGPPIGDDLEILKKMTQRLTQGE